MTKLVLPSALAFASIGCASAHAVSNEDPRSTPASTSAGTSIPGIPATAEYEVHEWGLVRQEATGDVVRIGSVAPPVELRPLVVLKPVLYFHTKGKLDLASVSVTAPSGGSILEVWPLLHNGRTGEAIGSRVEWTRVALDPTGECAPSPLPTIADPPCTALGADFCEVASLAVARTSDAACVTTNGTTERFLFYRGRSTTLRPPLVVARRGAAGEIAVTNTGARRIPGKIIRIRSVDGETSASASSPPEPNDAVQIAEPSGVSALELPASTGKLPATVGSAVLRDTLGELGLTVEEIDAFMRAWEPTLFPRPGYTQLDIQLDSVPGLRSMGRTESILYFLPEESTDDVAKLGFSPAPRVVRRAIAVWTALP